MASTKPDVPRYRVTRAAEPGANAAHGANGIVANFGHHEPQVVCVRRSLARVAGVRELNGAPRLRAHLVHAQNVCTPRRALYNNTITSARARTQAGGHTHAHTHTRTIAVHNPARTHAPLPPSPGSRSSSTSASRPCPCAACARTRVCQWPCPRAAGCPPTGARRSSSRPTAATPRGPARRSRAHQQARRAIQRLLPAAAVSAPARAQRRQIPGRRGCRCRPDSRRGRVRRPGPAAGRVAAAAGRSASPRSPSWRKRRREAHAAVPARARACAPGAPALANFVSSVSSRKTLVNYSSFCHEPTPVAFRSPGKPVFQCEHTRELSRAGATRR